MKMKLSSLAGCVVAAAASAVGSDSADVKQVAIIGQYLSSQRLHHSLHWWNAKEVMCNREPCHLYLSDGREQASCAPLQVMGVNQC